MPRDKANERGWGNASPQGIHGLCQRHQVAGVYQILDLLLRGVEKLNFAISHLAGEDKNETPSSDGRCSHSTIDCGIKTYTP